jgi:sugar phosphate isomerase/epimerase
MRPSNSPCRRSFLAASIAAPLALAARAAARPPASKVPVGLELYSVRDVLKEDLMGTVTAVAKMGYEVVEFYSPYFDWTPTYAKEVRKHLDGLGIKCLSTHNSSTVFDPENRAKAIELNGIIGSSSIVMAGPGRGVDSAGDWKNVAETLTSAQEQFAKSGMRAGYHNHASEWRAFEDGAGARHAMDILAAGTPGGVTLQLDVGTCVEMGQDPVAWIKAHPGRIRSMHCKDWAPGPKEDEKEFRVLVGEGASPWKEIVAAAESVGGIECYLIEQEGSRFSSIETAKRCLAAWKKITS